MRKSFTLLLLLFLPLFVWAQSVVVPKNVYFADIHLKISDEAQAEIQKKVDALHRHPSYFKVKVELADAYFPLIERTFREHGIPEDLKYLAIQESGLIGDAVSTSNAVGYWQFKREAASDFNLRMNNLVDERKHIVEASRGAAKYFIRSNTYYNNWFNSILSYYLGYSGAKTYTSPSDIGSKKMEITDKTHPYLLTFLAHKIAYENFVGKTRTPSISIKELRATPGQSLAEIALEHKADPSELEKYNKWLLGGSIPSDKEYTVMVPVRLADRSQVILASKDETSGPTRNTVVQNRAAIMKKEHGLNALVARNGDTKDILALQAGISTRKFLKYNDMHNFDEIVEGGIYYIEPKNNSGTVEFHVVQPGETTQQISQKHGIKLSQLLFKNRMSRNEVPVPGRVLWLQKRRPSNTPIEIQDVKGKQSKIASTGNTSSPATGVKSNPTTSSTVKPKTTAKQTEPAAKDNIFKRFIRSFDRFKKQPTAITEEPVKETAPVRETVAVTELEQKIEEVLMPTEGKSEVTNTSESQPKSKEVALYPGKKSAPVAPAPVTEKKQQDTVRAEAETVVMDMEEVEEVAIEQTAPIAIPVSKPQSTFKPTHHEVKQGETLYSISRLYATTVSDIISWNNLGDAPIKIGQELLIAEPLKTPEETPFQEEKSVPVQANSTFHEVAPGETLYQISKKYNVSLQNLQSWNNLVGNNIAVGQKLRIVAPAGEPAQVDNVPIRAETKAATVSGTENMYHTVAAGESMYQISRKYDVTIKDIMQWNNKSDFNVSLGEKLLIKRK